MFILCMILHFTKKQHYTLFGCHDSASSYTQMSDFNKMLYIFKTVTTFCNLNKIQSVQRMQFFLEILFDYVKSQISY